MDHLQLFTHFRGSVEIYSQMSLVKSTSFSITFATVLYAFMLKLFTKAIRPLSSAGLMPLPRRGL